MKMKVALNLLPVILLLVFTLQSCQKELSPETTTTPTTPTTPDSNYIAKIYEIEVNGTVADTVDIAVYNYDNLKRVVSIIRSSFNLYYYPSITYTYLYNAADTLPYRSTFISKSAYDAAQTQFYYDTVVSYHNYDNFGKNIKDSMIHSAYYIMSPVPYTVNSEVRNYSYGTGKIFGLTAYFTIFPSGTSSGDDKDTAITDATGNIIDNKIYRFNPSNSLFELDATSNFTFDTKASPFSRLSNFKTYGVFPSGETLFYEFPQYFNRLTQNEHHSFSGGSGTYFNSTYSNSYNSNGLLKEVLIYDVPPFPSTYGKESFIYKSL